MKTKTYHLSARTPLCWALMFVLWLGFGGRALAQPGWVLSHQKISDTEGDFDGTLDDTVYFGKSLAWLGDLDGDGVADLAAGAYTDDDGGTNRGAVWVLSLNSDGTVMSHQKISDTQGSFTGALDDFDFFGASAASLGDFDGDGVGDLAVGAHGDDDGGDCRGAVWILCLNADGTVKTHQKISDTVGGFTGILNDTDYFGWSLAALGDLNGDGVVDLAVGAEWDDDGGIPPNANRGAVWILFLNIDGTVKAHQKISDTQGGFDGTLDDFDAFGYSVASLGDLDSDGVSDLAVGAINDDDGGSARGAVWVLFLNVDGTVKSHQKISDTEGGFTGTLDDFGDFGSSLASLGDLDGDRVGDLVVGQHAGDDGGHARGAVWILFLNPDGTVKSHQKISDTQGAFTGGLSDVDLFGAAVASVGDLDGDGLGDLAVGAMSDDDGGGFNRGAVWVLFLGLRCEGDANGDGTVDPLDSGYVLARFGCPVGTGDAGCDIADQNGDGAVDPLDVGFVLARFGACD
ncbi:MAG: FG-GAP repeat protein [Planctomycetes bacterium]|nr:FG-GAP repeat protein [Planctomycetota bacterium]